MSYRGLTIPLPVGQQGFTGTENPSQAGPGHLLYTDGAELDAGIIRKEGGATKFNASALTVAAVPAAILAGINWSPLTGVFRDVVFLDGGTVLKDSGAGTFPTTMASGLVTNRDPPPLFVLGGGESVGSSRRLFLFSAGNQVQTVAADGGALAAISAPAADWTGAGNFPIFGALHGFRLWGGGNASDPHRLYYSTLTSHQDFTGAGSGQIAIFPGEGERIVGAISFRGALVVWKYPHGIYIVNTSDPTPANWSVVPLTRAVGGLNQQGIMQIENDVLYMDAIGSTHSLSSTNEFGDFTTSDIGEADKIANFMRRSVNLSKMRRVSALWYAKKQQAWFALPLIGGDNNNLRFITVFEGAPQPDQAPVHVS